MPHELTPAETKALARIRQRPLYIVITDGAVTFWCGPNKIKPATARRLIELGLLMPHDAGLLPGSPAQTYRACASS